MIKGFAQFWQYQATRYDFTQSFFVSELTDFGEVQNSDRLLGKSMLHFYATRKGQPVYCFELDQNQ